MDRPRRVANIYWVLSVCQTLCSLLVLSHLIFTISQWIRYYCHQFIGDETEAQRAVVTYLRSPNSKWQSRQPRFLTVDKISTTEQKYKTEFGDRETSLKYLPVYNMLDEC